LYPKVRFRGFDEPWKKVKLGRNVKRIRRKNKNLETNIPLTISAQFGLVDQRDFLGRVVASENLANYILLKRGEFAYNKSYSKEAPYGSIKRLEKYNEGALSTLYIAFTPENINSDFLKAFFDTTKWYSHIVQVSTEGARNHGLLNISPQDFFEMSITIPKSDEQNNISRIYNLMNSLLSLQQRKLELEKQIFYALKTHIFAKDLFFNGQKDMIKYKLKDVSNMYQPETITATQMSTNGYKVFGANGYIGHYYNFNHKDDAITICARGASTGAVNFVPGPVWITGNSMVVDIDSKLINQLYFYYYLTTLNLKKYITGGAQPQLTKEILNGINVNLIPINIQIKVANILVLKLSNFLCK